MFFDRTIGEDLQENPVMLLKIGGKEILVMEWQ